MVRPGHPDYDKNIPLFPNDPDEVLIEASKNEQAYEEIWDESVVMGIEQELSEEEIFIPPPKIMVEDNEYDDESDEESPRYIHP